VRSFQLYTKSLLKVKYIVNAWPTVKRELTIEDQA
jgi:hypothetical protein